MISAEKLAEKIHSLENIAARGIERRGFKKLHTAGNMVRATEAIYESHGTILITTGFPVPGRIATENDGPPGAAALAYVLCKMGRSVEIITDIYSRKALETAIAVLAIDVTITVWKKDQIAKSADCRHFHADKYGAFIVIERPGLAADGKMYDMQGTELNAEVPSFDILLAIFVNAQKVTVAIGDGGNELGMGGSLREHVRCEIPMGEVIGARDAAEFQILAGVSNWGGWALAGGLSLLAVQNIMCSPAKMCALLQALLAIGVFDGYANALPDTASVDGIVLPVHEEIYSVMYTLCQISRE